MVSDKLVVASLLRSENSHRFVTTFVGFEQNGTCARHKGMEHSDTEIVILNSTYTWMTRAQTRPARGYC
jgi:hypothetical protein